MHRGRLFVLSLLLPTSLVAQASRSSDPPNAAAIQFGRFADIFGGRLVAAFDSIPASRYDYRPTPMEQTVGYIAQHLENANYGLCERMGPARHRRTAKDSLPDTVKARWPKDTLVARLEASLRFCDTTLDRLVDVNSAQLAANLLGFETDLAEHYSQISVYMRLLGLVPPSALPPRHRTPIELPVSSLSRYVGTYEIISGYDLVVTMSSGGLWIRSSLGGDPLRLWPESPTEFFVAEADAQISFRQDAGGSITGLVAHQYGRDRVGKKIR